MKTLIGDSIDSFLEPAIGTGVFFSALSEQTTILECEGYEIDKHYYMPAKSLWKKCNITIHNQDFLAASPSKKFSLIISNPPYSRHHHIDPEKKHAYSKLIKRMYGLEISGLSGLYVYFMILSTQWLKKEGYSCWLIPSEFLSVNYGTGLKQFLLTHVDLISIHTFTSEDVQFDDALVSSSIVIFKNSKPTTQPIIFSWGGNIDTPKTTHRIPKEDLNPFQKWNESFLTWGKQNSTNVSTIGDFFNIKRGVATGDNDFFIVNDEIINQYGISKDVLTPVLPPPRKLKSNIFQSESSDIDKGFLLSCNLPFEIIKKRYPGLYDYLIYGIEKQVPLRANCRNRTYWYSCETRETAPILVSYMGRNNGKSPIRFILNEGHAIATNSYLMLYPKNEYKYLFNDTNIAKRVWNILSGIPIDVLIAYGRTYGGGLIKWEPKELASIPCLDLKNILKTQSPSLFDF